MLDFWVIWCQKHHEGIAKKSPKHVRWITLGYVRIDYFVSLYLSKLSLHHEAGIARESLKVFFYVRSGYAVLVVFE